jgi:Fe2+ transport system protein FeoA
MTQEVTSLNFIPEKTEAFIASVLTKDLGLVSRLKAFGVIEGTLITVLRRSAFSGPLVVLVRGCKIALRRSEAEIIKVTTFHKKV